MKQSKVLEKMEQAWACKTSRELYALAEELLQAVSDSQEELELAELARDWVAIEHYVGLVAHWKYLYKTIYGWAKDLAQKELQEILFVIDSLEELE